MTFEFSTDNEVTARNLMQRFIGGLYMTNVKIDGWTLADVTRGKYRNVLSHDEHAARMERRRRGRGG